VQLDRLVATVAPALVAVKGVGTETAAALLVAGGDNPQRLRSEAAFAHLCGVAPTSSDAPSKASPRPRVIRCLKRYIARELYRILVSARPLDEP